MPIISGSDKSQPSLNGDTSLLLNSMDDEESFVVLERSTANDLILNSDITELPSQSFQIPPADSFPVFNNLTSSRMTSSQTSHRTQVAPVESLELPFDSTNISVSAEEIQKRLQEVLHENISLKENLYQTNLAMKQQLSTVRLLQDRASEVQKNHQSKFEETKTLILKLGSEKNELQEENSSISGELKKLKEENKELKESNTAFGAEAAKLLLENAGLKQQLSTIQETLQTVTENGRKASLQPSQKEVELHEVVDQLTRKLELVERARRQQEFDIDRLQAQVGRATQELNESQQKLALTKNELEVAQSQAKPEVQSESTFQFGERFTKYNDLLIKLKTTLQEEQTKMNSLSSWLSMTDPVGTSSQFEIAELRRLLAEEQTQSVARKENLYRAIATIHDMLSDIQKLDEELEKMKADRALKESHGMAYDEMQKKGFRERLDSLTARLVEREEALAISERHLSSLKAALQLQNEEKMAKPKEHWTFNWGNMIKKTQFMEPFWQDELCWSTIKEGGETKALKEQVQVLANELATKEELLKANNQEMESLKAQMQNINTTVTVLQEQANIYKTDFEAERGSRESLVAEKERLVEDLRHLQRRNQELIDEIAKIRNDPRQFVPQAPPASTYNPRREERSPSPPPPKSSENLEIGNKKKIFHEKQDGYLCAQHCLNSLLQGAYYNAADLAELAQEMDFAEKTKLSEGGVDSKDYQSFLNKPSENFDDTGNFSVQVISCALALWGLEMFPYNSTEPRVVAARNNFGEIKAFICNSSSHWFTIRRLGNQWFNLNSTLDEPEPISDTYLDLFLAQIQEEGNSIFIILGNLPKCPADVEMEGELTPDKNKTQLEDILSKNDKCNLRNTTEVNALGDLSSCLEDVQTVDSQTSKTPEPKLNNELLIRQNYANLINSQIRNSSLNGKKKEISNALHFNLSIQNSPKHHKYHQQIQQLLLQRAQKWLALQQ